MNNDRRGQENMRTLFFHASTLDAISVGFVAERQHANPNNMVMT
jgi:hypothetical protein